LVFVNVISTLDFKIFFLSRFPFILFIFFTYVAGVCQDNTPLTEFGKAFKLYQKKEYSAAMKIVREISKAKGSVSAEELLIKGYVLNDSLGFDSAKVYFEEAKRQLVNSADAKLKCKPHFGLGRGYYNAAEYKESIREFLLMESEARKAGLKPEEKSACFYLAEDFQALNQVPVSNQYARRSIGLAKEIGDTASIFRGYTVWISNYIIFGYSKISSSPLAPKKKDLTAEKYGDSALVALKEMAMFTDSSNYDRMGVLNDLYSGAWSCKSDFGKQLAHALLAYRYFIRAGNPNNSVATCSKIGSAYVDLQKFDSAIYYFEKTKALKADMNAGLAEEDERVFNYEIYRAYKGQGNEKLALTYLEKYLQQDFELNEGKNLDIQKLREEFESEKIKQHIADEKAKTTALYRQKQRFYLYGAVVVLLVLLSGAWLFYRRLRIRKEKEKRELQLLLQNAELTALKAQMNPHFIFNALNSIQHSIITNNTDDACRFLSKFSKLIRNVLDSSSEQVIPLKTEIETLTLYTEIEAKRFDNSFHYTLEIKAGGVDMEKLTVPSMIIQPFIENAIWHGLMPKEEQKMLKIVFEIPNENTITVIIEDNGVGRKKAREIAAKKNKPHRSKGLANIKERASLLEITQSLKIEIEINDLSDTEGNASGTRACICFIKHF
jgi:hypothetical protein